MRNDIFLEPESEYEMEAINRIADARDYALDEADLSPEEVAAVFNQFAVGLLVGDSQEESGESFTCPECDDVLTDVESPGIGMDPVGVPCGCSLSAGEVPVELWED